MKKLLLGLTCFAALTACGNEGADDHTLTIGASNVPHAQILEQAKPLLAEEGIELEIKVFQDYVLPNKTLVEGDLDANYFQHLPYLNQYNLENNTDIVNAGGIHIEPIGIYSKRHDSLDTLPDGATVLMSSSVSDHGRMLSLLQTAGLIELDASVDPSAATLEDVVKNPKNLVFEAEVDAGLLVQLYNNDEGDIVLINTNYALDGGLNPLEDAITLEGSESFYVNIIAVNKGDESREDIQTLIDVLRSEEIQSYIISEYGGSVVPVSE